MKESIFKSFDGYELHCYLWDDVENPKGVFQITHGMAEHAKRYDRFAKFLNQNGYICFANDIRAHGQSAGSPEKVGLVVNGDLFSETVKDQILLSEYLVKEYPTLPLFYMGHSYGSFISQKYVQECHLPKGVILMGSAHQGGLLRTAGAVVAALTILFKGKDSPAKMIAAMSFGAYQKQFTEGVWITSDKSISDQYLADPYCGMIFSCGFYKYFFKGLKDVYIKKNLAKIPKDYPIFIVSGELDPVGGPKTLVTKLYNMYLKEGLTKVDFKLYPNMRHEILNEIGYEKPYNDILNYINSLL